MLKVAIKLNIRYATNINCPIFEGKNKSLQRSLKVQQLKSMLFVAGG
jgi:hypothetical protein